MRSKGGIWKGSGLGSKKGFFAAAGVAAVAGPAAVAGASAFADAADASVFPWFADAQAVRATTRRAIERGGVTEGSLMGCAFHALASARTQAQPASWTGRTRKDLR